MIKIAMVEDEKAEMELVKSYLERFLSEKTESYEFTWFNNPVEFLTKFNSSYDLILLDIELPDMNGMTLAHKIRKIDSSVSIIFVTNMAQFAIKGYEVAALDFIVKPVSYYDFALKIEHLLKKLKNNNNTKIKINCEDVVKFVSISDIQYVEVIKHKLQYHTSEGLFEARGALKKVEPQLIENNFVKCNNYCIVNLKYVSGIKGYELILSSIDGTKSYEYVMISHPRKKDFVKALNSYLEENQ